MQRNRKPRWGRLYAVGFCAFAGLTFEAALPLPEAARRLALIVIALATFGAVALWIADNASALEDAPWDDEREGIEAGVEMPHEDENPASTPVQLHYRRVTAMRRESRTMLEGSESPCETISSSK